MHCLVAAHSEEAPLVSLPFCYWFHGNGWHRLCRQHLPTPKWRSRNLIRSSRIEENHLSRQSLVPRWRAVCLSIINIASSTYEGTRRGCGWATSLLSGEVLRWFTLPYCSKYFFTSSTVVLAERPPTKIFFVRVTILRKKYVMWSERGERMDDCSYTHTHTHTCVIYWRIYGSHM